MSEEHLRAVLIHGTFARKAAWVKETSPLAVALMDAFPSIKSVDAPNWRGWNTFNERLRGADKVIRVLDSLHESEKAIICAHSHGGSVLCYALQQRPDLVNKVSAAVFLATPFYSCRLLPSWRVLFDGFFAPVLFGIYLVGLASAFLGFFALTVLSAGILSIFIILFCEGGLRALLCLNRCKLRLAKRCLVAALRAGRRVSCELPHGTKALFIRLSGDEASAALTFAQAVSWIVTSINVLYARVIRIVVRPLNIVRPRHPIIIRVVFVIVCLIIGAALLAWLIFDVLASIVYVLDLPALHDVYRGKQLPPPPNPDKTIVFSVLGWHVTASALGNALHGVAVLILVGPLLVFAGSVILFVLNWSVSICFGIMPFFIAGMLQPAIDATPPGMWEVKLVSWRSYGRTIRLPFWRHSNPYAEPKVISEVVSWLKQHI